LKPERASAFVGALKEAGRIKKASICGKSVRERPGTKINPQAEKLREVTQERDRAKETLQLKHASERAISRGEERPGRQSYSSEAGGDSTTTAQNRRWKTGGGSAGSKIIHKKGVRKMKKGIHEAREERTVS